MSKRSDVEFLDVAHPKLIHDRREHLELVRQSRREIVEALELPKRLVAIVVGGDSMPPRQPDRDVSIGVELGGSPLAKAK